MVGIPHGNNEIVNNFFMRNKKRSEIMNKNRLLFFTSIIVLIMLLGVFTIGSAQEVKTVKIGVSVADQSNPFYIEILD